MINNIAVCGKFHILNHAGFLAQNGALQALYFSHRSDSAQKYEIPHKLSHNKPLKEYLIQGHGRLLGKRFYEEFIPFYMSVWERQVLLDWNRATLWHVLAQGACNRIIKRALGEKSKILVEVVNTHPLNRLNILKHEGHRRGLHVRDVLLKREERVIDEVAAAHALLAPSKVVAKSYSDQYPDKKVFVLPYSANITRFSPGPKRVRSDDPVKILCVGEIGLRKGQLYLLEALKRYQGKVQLTLVGVISPQISGLLDSYLGMFTHHERVRHEEMPDFYRAHDLFVAPSLEEGLALSICEAMASGLAVIASKQSGAEEIITDGVSGLLFDAGNQMELENALQRAISSSDLRNYLAESAARKSAELMNWGRYAEELAKIYKALNGD